MKAPKKSGNKAAAAVAVPQSREEVISCIREIGDIQRDILRRETELNDRIAALTEEVAPFVKEQMIKLAELQSGVQTWCEANRADLTQNGKVKTANLITGEIRWRVHPPSVRLTKVDDVIALLQKLKLHKFLREKTEVDKEAILASPDEVKGLAGITIKKDQEFFEIVPFEQSITD